MDISGVGNLGLTILDNIPHRVFVKDRDLIYRFCNAAYAADCGRNAEDVQGSTDMEIHPEHVAVKYRKDDTAVLAGRANFDVIEQLDRADETITVRTIKRPVRDEDGEIIGVMGMYWEIAGELKNRTALEESRSQLRMALEGTDIGTWSWDARTKKLIWDQQCSRIYGITARNEGTCAYFLNLVHPDDRNLVERAVTESQGDSPDFEVEYRVRRPDSTVRFLNTRGERYRNSIGITERISGITMDVTKRHRTEEALRSILSMNQLMTRSSLDEILQLGLEESVRITESRIGFFHLVNEESGEISLQRWSADTVAMCDVPELNRHYPMTSAGIWADCVRQRRPIIHNDYAAAEGRKGLPEGHFPLERELTVPIFNEDAIVAIIGVGNKSRYYNEFDIAQLSLLGENIWNIVSRKRTEEALEHAHASAVQANRVKDRFFSIIAHDLTNPISNIRILADQMELMTDDPNTDPALFAEISAILSRSVNNAQILLKDLLTWSRAQRDAIAFKPERIRAEEAVETALASCSSMAESKRIRLEGSWPKGLAVHADTNMLQTILRNLVVNAVKFTPRGGSVSVEISESSEGMVYIVRDSGIGMPPDRIENLFRPGNEVSTSGTNDERGTGLGLALCKEFTERHSGTIAVESELGKGSVFTVVIPRREEPDEATPRTKAS